ncbi:uncharacterized protein LOC135847871 [Planococcus citri]|uniref:uncharacterized protein LOC135847871 n=1 Tax=Planococcus citri TaxID=170843 RepID=UPI0031F8A10A
MFFDNVPSSWVTLIINFLLFLIIILYHDQRASSVLAAENFTLAAGTAAAADVATTSAFSDAADRRLENVTVFLKSWPFRMVRKECESLFLYNYGYTSVLVSSIQDKKLLKKHSENFQFNDLFKFRTSLGTIEEFASMIKSCEKNGIKVYVSLKLITDKQIDQVVKRYEEIEPFLMRKLAQRIKKSREVAAKRKAQSSVTSPNNRSKKPDITSFKLPSSISTNSSNQTTPRDEGGKSPKKPSRFDENFMKKRHHKNTKYLMELVLLQAATRAAHDQGILSLIQSFKQVNKQYRLRYKKNKILSENSPIPGLIRKYCKLKYNLEDISSAVKFVKLLAELGVSGVRIENSRFIDTNALERIFNTAQKDISKKMAIIFDDVINVKHYQKFGSVMDEKYARNLMDAVKKINFQKLVSKKKMWPRTWRNIASSDKSRPFVPKYMIPEDNKSDSYNFKIATSMMLVNPHGFPIIVSPYSRVKAHIKSLPNADNSSMDDICSRGKFCIHRKKFIRQLVLFRLITADDKITSIRALRNNILHLNRGNKGFAAFIHKLPPSKDKVPTSTEDLTIQTELPPGLYCNIITGYPDLKRDQCNPGSVIQVDLKGQVTIKNPNTYEKGVLAIDILSRLKYVDIEANGKYVFQTKPSSLKRDKGQNTGSNFKPRDLDDLRDNKSIINPTSASSSPQRPSDVTLVAPAAAEIHTRDLDDVFKHSNVKFKFDFSDITDIITKPFKYAKHIIEKFIDMIKDAIKDITGHRRKYPKIKFDHGYDYRY